MNKIKLLAFYLGSQSNLLIYFLNLLFRFYSYGYDDGSCGIQSDWRYEGIRMENKHDITCHNYMNHCHKKDVIWSTDATDITRSNIHTRNIAYILKIATEATQQQHPNELENTNFIIKIILFIKNTNYFVYI